MLDPAAQAVWLRRLSESQPEQEKPVTEEISYTRRKAKLWDDDCVSEQGLRFDDSVPVEIIEIPVPELN